ncbi:MAG: porin family protein [Hyphomicrobiaceae bacterium]|nr:MAG: porin family protein [Hyphomicrobiaceae bacterium]
MNIRPQNHSLPMRILQFSVGVNMKALRFALLALAAGASVGLLATDANAGGSLKDAPYARPFSWTGFYIGAHLGAGFSDVDWQYNNTTTTTDHSGSGVLAGGQVGYNWQTGGLVLGIEADGAWTNTDGSTSCPNAAFTCGHEVNWMASVRGRAGAVLGGKTLVYGTAGWGWADIDYSATTPGGPNFGYSKTHSGWVAGGGIEHMFAANMSAKFEYLAYVLDDVTAPVGTLSGITTTTLDPTIHTVKIGVNFKF